MKSSGVKHTSVTALTRSGLERRLKRRLLKATHRFLAITTPGFEPILRAGLEALPAITIEENIAGGVLFRGPFQTVYHANLRLRTASRVLLRVDSFTARSYPELYNKAKRICWELFCGFNHGVAFEVTSRSSRLHHTGNVAQAIGTACADHMAGLGLTIEQKPDSPIRFHVRYADDVCTISINSSGELLHKRGYRLEGGHAPLRETIAAALLAQAQWRNYKVIADPLCGSGTLVIEAALMAAGRAPGAYRTFAFEEWPAFKPTLWERLKREAVGKTVSPVRIIGSDMSEAAVDQAVRNAERAGVSGAITFTLRDCFTFNLKGEIKETGLIVSNLPYGKRAFTSHQALGDFYRQWGEHLKKHCQGWTFGFVVADESFGAIAGLPVASTIRFENGGLPVLFVTGVVP
jgi:putative N6-adenine-specific DNA methylase